MCLAKVFLNDEQDAPVAESVTSLTAIDGGFAVTTLFNEKLTFTGELRSIDFTDSEIHIQTN